MQAEKSHPEGKRIMPETRLTEFPALSVDPRVGISWSAMETDDRFNFLPMTLKIIIYHSSFLLYMTFYVMLFMKNKRRKESVITQHHWAEVFLEEVNGQSGRTL